MANSEDYLDGLLNSVKNVREDVSQAQAMSEQSRKRREEQRNKIKPDDDFMEASGLSGYVPERTTHENLRKIISEEDFLRSFEEELELDSSEYDSILQDFEQELEEEFQEEFSTTPEEYAETAEDEAENTAEDTTAHEESDSSFLQNIENIVSQAKEQIEQGENPFEEEETPAEAETEAETPNASEVEKQSPKEALESAPAAEKELSPLDAFAPDELDEMLDGPIGEPGEDLLEKYQQLHGMSEENGETPLMDENAEDADLMDLLSSDSEFDDLGALLEADENQTELAEAQAEFEEKANSEVEASAQNENASEGEGEEEGEKKGLLAKILSLFSKKKKDENEVLDINAEEGEDLTQENLDILKSLDEAEKKAEKPKKEKKKKEPKEKKPKEKKPKEKKPKKEKVKKEKKVDNSPVIPMKIILLFLLLGGSIVAFVTIGEKALGYQMHKNAAQSAYDKTDYLGAYQELMGVTLKEDDEELFKKSRLLADLQMKNREYNVMMSNKEYAMALDSLIIGVGRYNENVEEAKSFGIENEYIALGEELTQLLTNQFGISMEEALEIYQRNREDYSIRINQIIKEQNFE